ncbi:MAG: hypothetical protein AAGF12_15245 [Myxococcota bacterium]
MASPESGPVAAPELGLSASVALSDRRSDRVVMFDLATRCELGTLITVPPVDRPSGVRADADGNLYVANFGDGSIVRSGPHGSSGLFFHDTLILEEPVELQFLGSELLVLGKDSRRFVVFDSETGEVAREFGSRALSTAHDFVVNSAGQALVAAGHNAEAAGAIQIWDLATGTLIGGFGSVEEVGLATSLALIDDEVVVADYSRDRVVAFDAATGTFRRTVAELPRPRSIAVGPEGALWVLDATALVRVAPDTGDAETWISYDAAGIERADNIAFVPAPLSDLAPI